MLILNETQLVLTGATSLDECCPYCAKALGAYPLISSDETWPCVYHAACAIQLATDILVDLFTFLSPPPPSGPFFTLSASCEAAHPQGESYALNESQRD